MNKLDKALAKLSKPDRSRILAVLELIEARSLDGLDLKKLKGADDLYRVRIGKMRIIFNMTDKYTRIIEIAKKSDNTYNL